MATHSLSRTDTVPSLFNDFFKPWSEWLGNGDLPARTATLPAVNISENNERYQLSLAAPGLRKEDLHIDVDDSVLTISAEKEENRNESGERFNRREYSFTSFSRSFGLPSNVQADKIEAQYQDGVLNVSIPKKNPAAANAPTKRVEIK